MTNAMIILLESIKLMEQGILEPTGETLTVDNGDGTTKELDIPEAIHTYQVWKTLGYQVKKGEKAIAQFPIWKYVKGKTQEIVEDEEVQDEVVRKGYCRMVNSSFFKASQVQEVAK